MLGPNGAGKTSTIEALEGLRRPTGGRLSVVGLDPQADHAALTARIGVMLQEGGIHPAVRVGEAVRHAAALYPDPVDPASLVDQLGLAGLEARPYRRLSGGEQRRVALALALVGPTAGGVPRRADGGGRPRGPAGDPPGCRRPAERGGDRAAHHPRPRRGRARRRPGGHRRRGPAGGRRHRRRAHQPRIRRRRAAVPGPRRPRPALARHPPRRRRCDRDRPRRVPRVRRTGTPHRRRPHGVAGRPRPAARRPSGRPPAPRGRLPPPHGRDIAPRRRFPPRDRSSQRPISRGNRGGRGGEVGT